MNRAPSNTFKKKPSKLLIFSIISLLSGLILGYFGRNIFASMIAILLFWFGFIPALFGFLICALIGKFQKEESQSIRRLRSALKIIMASTIILSITTTIVGMSLLNDDIETAQAFCIELANQIESVKEKTGTYPSNIDIYLASHKKLPRFIDERCRYYRSDEGYELSFIATGGLFPRFYTYRSNTGKWEIQD